MLLEALLGGTAPSIPLILLFAIALDGAFGEFGPLLRRLPHPVVLIGGAVGALESRFNAEGLEPNRLRWRGALVVLFLVALAVLAGLGVSNLARVEHFLWPVEALGVAVLLAQRSLYDHVRAVAEGLERDGLAGGRAAVRLIVGRDPNSLGEHGVGRAAIESLAENYSDGVVAPAFWYLLFGLPGIVAYKTVNTLDSMIGHKSARYVHFGMVAARLDDLVNLVPARLSGMWIALAAAFLPGASVRRALATMPRDAPTHRSPNAGWPEAAMAGALNIKLAGPRRYPGEVVDAPFIGPGTPDVSVADIWRALRLFVLACAVHAGFVALFLLR